MKKFDQYARSYAALVVQSGISLRKGQSLLIKTGYGTYPFARLIAETAYKLGALQVVVDIDDPQLTRARIDAQQEAEVTVLPDYQRQIDYEMMVKDWAYVRIDNTEDRHWLADADAVKLSAMRKAASTWSA